MQDLKEGLQEALSTEKCKAWYTQTTLMAVTLSRRRMLSPIKPDHKPVICCKAAVCHNAHQGMERAVFSPSANTKEGYPVQLNRPLPP